MQKIYAKRVLKRVIDVEPDLDPNKIIKTSGEIKIRGLSDKRVKQSDPWLAWMIFHSITKMHREVNKREGNANKELSKDIPPQSEPVVHEKENLPKPSIDNDILDSTVNTKK